MAQTHEASAGMTMTMEQFQALIDAIRKPPIDPIKELQRKREQATKQEANDSMWRMKLERKKNCTHMRPPTPGGAPSCAISWAVQSDGKERGHCPHCNSVFRPEDTGEELEIYHKVRALPRGMLESVRYL
jgi:membrane protease subunit (stomatin/prohibitin family)